MENSIGSSSNSNLSLASQNNDEQLPTPFETDPLQTEANSSFANNNKSGINTPPTASSNPTSTLPSPLQPSLKQSLSDTSDSEEDLQLSRLSMSPPLKPRDSPLISNQSKRNSRLFNTSINSNTSRRDASRHSIFIDNGDFDFPQSAFNNSMNANPNASANHSLNNSANTSANHSRNSSFNFRDSLLPQSLLDGSRLPGDSTDIPTARLRNNKDGIRSQEARIRELETMVIDLRLEAQHYKTLVLDGNAAAKFQSELTSKTQRVSELENALQLKTETIRKLTAERDLYYRQMQNSVSEDEVKQLHNTVMELQQALNELTNSEMDDKDRHLLEEAHQEYPDIIKENATINELLTTIKELLAAQPPPPDFADLNSTLNRNGFDGDLETAVRSLIKSFQDISADFESVERNYQQESFNLRRQLENLTSEHNIIMSDRNQLANNLGKLQKLKHELESKIDDLELVNNEYRKTSYELMKQYFDILIRNAEETYSERIIRELDRLSGFAKREKVSKLPLLSNYMLHCTRELISQRQPRPSSNLEAQVKSLVSQLELKLDAAGANKIALAQIKELRRALKYEQEKRKLEREEYKLLTRNGK